VNLAQIKRGVCDDTDQRFGREVAGVLLAARLLRVLPA
jgi:hypothetical protein